MKPSYGHLKVNCRAARVTSPAQLGRQSSGFWAALSALKIKSGWSLHVPTVEGHFQSSCVILSWDDTPQSDLLRVRVSRSALPIFDLPIPIHL